jgi:hypothetical protein
MDNSFCREAKEQCLYKKQKECQHQRDASKTMETMFTSSSMNFSNSENNCNNPIAAGIRETVGMPAIA